MGELERSPRHPSRERGRGERRGGEGRGRKREGKGREGGGEGKGPHIFCCNSTTDYTIPSGQTDHSISAAKLQLTPTTIITTPAFVYSYDFKLSPIISTEGKK